MATKFPVSMGTFCPRLSILTSVNLMRHVTIHVTTARTRPDQAAMIAPVPDAFSQVIMFQRGITADPIKIPINRYTHPRLSPIMSRSTARPPIVSPNPTIIIRETNKI